MTEEKMLTVRDVAIMLGVSEKDVLDLTESGIIPGYKVGGVYLRFKKEQVQEYQKKSRPFTSKTSDLEKNSFGDRLSDFFYFNDFYILAGALIILLLAVILQG